MTWWAALMIGLLLFGIVAFAGALFHAVVESRK